MRRLAAVVITACAASAQYSAPRLLAKLEDRAINESSGIAASRLNAGVYWTHNDSGSAPLLFAFDRTGRALGRWRIDPGKPADLEGIAVGPGPVRGRQYVYAGDIGDNNRRRPEIVIYRAIEPEIRKAARDGIHTLPCERLRLRYPDRPRDAEALLVHPRTGEVYVVTKARGADAETVVFKAPALMKADSITTLELVGRLTFPGASAITLVIGGITGGDISPDGTRVVLCDYLRAYEIVLASGAPFDSIWKRPISEFLFEGRKQGEAICYRADGKAILATSEGSPCPLFEAVSTRR